MVTTVKTLKDLKGASYNPRYISDKQLKNLQKSVERFGDLSGVVFNITSGVLVSGHQRIKTIEQFPTKIVKTKVKDKHGTVAIGHIEAQTDAGLIKFPYREVAWDDKLAEMAANVAANAAGGEFDQAKLGAIMSKLEKGGFDIETTSIDNWTMSKAIGKFKKTGNSDGREDKFSAPDEDTGDFDTVDPKAMAFDHECPRCSFRWSDSSSKPVARPKPNAAKLVKSSRSKEPEVVKIKAKASAKTKPAAKPVAAKKAAPAKKAAKR